MANLLGQNIGTNYKGILNLNTLNGNLSGTLQAVTDGDGNASPLQLSTTEVAILGNTTGGGVSGLKFGSINSNFGGIWSALVATPATNNYGISIGVNYTELRGILGLYLVANYTTIGNVSSTGLALGKGATAASTRLDVRGDGTNPIARFENSAGSAVLRISSGATNEILQFGSSAVQPPLLKTLGVGGAANLGGNFLEFVVQNGDNTAGNIAFRFNGSGSSFGNVTGTSQFMYFDHLYQAAAGAGNYRHSNFIYTINNSGAQTGTATGIFLNATETALNGMGHNLMDLQIGGVSKFRFRNDGQVNTTGGIYSGTDVYANSTSGYLGWSGVSLMRSPSAGVISLYNSTATDFSRLQLGGTTNAFPAIKRNGAGIDFRLADDSGYARINVGGAALNGENGYIALNNSLSIDSSLRALRTDPGSSPLFISTGEVGIGSNTTFASAIFAITSTTRGFLPPRLTTTERDLIATPAAGLMIYNTTTNRPNFYDGSAWVAL